MKLDFEYLSKPVHLQGFDGDHISRQLEQSGTFYEIELLKYISNLALTGLYIDVGANIGNHSVFFGKFCTADHVIAVEPYVPAYELLEINIHQNGLSERITPLNCAMGSKNGEVTLIPGKLSNIGHTRVAPGTGTNLNRVDDLGHLGDVSVIKIDVEGYESEVLLGASEILANNRPHLFVEALKLSNKRSVDRILKPLGYSAIRRFGRAATYHYSPTAKYM